VDAFGCGIFVSSTKAAIGAAIASRRIADTKNVFGFIGECLSRLPSIPPRLWSDYRHHPIVYIGWNANLLQDVTKEVLGLRRRQISENDDDRFVVRVIAIDRLSGQEHSLVAVYELDDI
jgi:hypothetical protein